jgi:uncharacterized membrane protein
LEGVEDAMNETAESAGESAEELEGFSERFAGAMSAAVAALAVGAAGLLSQVPVLGEAFSGLAAIVQALAFQMDGVLRPVLTPVTNAFFELADAIFEADGILGAIIGTVTTIVSILAVAIPAIAAIGSQLGVWASVGAGVVAILGKIAAVVAGVAGAIVSLPAAIAVAIAAILAFAAAYLTNWRGTRDKTNAIIGQIVDIVTEGFNSLASQAIEGLVSFSTDVAQFFIDLANGLSEWASDLASDAREWGKTLIENIIAGIRSAIGRLQNWLGDLQDVGATVGIDIPDLGGLGGGGGGGGGGGSGRLPFRGSGTASGAQIDGRQLTESTGRYRSDPGRRRGL